MDLTFKPISRSEALEYLSWRYQAPYSLYNFNEAEKDVEIDGMMNPKNKAFSVLSHNEFIGVRSFGDDGKVKGGTYDDSYQDTGGALRPDLTGKGYGESVIRAGLKFGNREFGFERFRVTIATFNLRAVKVCERIGFTENLRFRRESDDEEFSIFTLDKLTESKAVQIIRARTRA